MNYRSADGVLQGRLDEADRELAELRARERELGERCTQEEAKGRELSERLAITGLGGASRGPTVDRIGVLIAGLCVVGAAVALPEIYIGGYVRRQPEETVIPILLLGGPGILAAVIAWPFRGLRGYRGGFICALLLVAFSILNVVVGFAR